MASFFADLEWRGLVQQITDPKLPEMLDAGGMTGYIGFDPTAPSLHLGSLLPILGLRRMQLAGNTPIALAGGGTGLIGDPGGRRDERPLLSLEDLKENVAGIRGQLDKFLDFSSGKTQAKLVDNSDWLRELDLLDFLRDVGKHFTVNEMIAKESVKTRLEGREQGISFTEFSYMLLQAYDFLYLFDNHGCTLQMGGSDQWGNITMGTELIRKLRAAPSYGLTMPLLLKADGTKFGKSEGGNVWLDPALTSPYKMYQFLVRTEDADVGKLLRFYTFLDREQIEALEKRVADAPEQREAQRVLAYEVTSLVHGKEPADAAVRASEALFKGDVSALDERTLLEALEEAPRWTVGRSELAQKTVAEALVGGEVAKSLSDARRAISQGGVYLNGERVDETDRTLTTDDVSHGRYVVLRKGKRDYLIVDVTN